MTKYVAIDGDGVLFDYNLAAALLYERMYKEKLKRVNPGAYNFHIEYDIANTKHPEFHKMTYPMFDKMKVWGKMPGLEGALEATKMMKDKGYTLVCLTSMPPTYQSLRLQNAIDLGFPISECVAVDRRAAKRAGVDNPKKQWIMENKPVAFIDDLLKNFVDMEDVTETQLVWLDNKHIASDNPNLSHDKNMVHKIVYSLQELADSLPVYKAPFTPKF